MKIISSRLKTDLEGHVPVKLDLGCGQSPRQGFYAVDLLEMPGVDVVADLNRPLSLLPDNSCEHLYSRHCLEHVQDFLPLMREIHRVVKPGGKIEIIVPHFSNVYGHSDPTHVRLFGLFSMYYFVRHAEQPSIRQVPEFYSDTRFHIRSIRIDFYRISWLDRIVAPILTRLVNMSFVTQNFYERRLANLFHAWEIKYVMEPEKR